MHKELRGVCVVTIEITIKNFYMVTILHLKLASNSCCTSKCRQSVQSILKLLRESGQTNDILKNSQYTFVHHLLTGTSLL